MPTPTATSYAYRTRKKYDVAPTSRTTTPTRKRAVIYCRISRDIEGKGLGVARQEKECRELCERKGFEVVAVLTDNDISAFNRKYRRGYEQVLDMLRFGQADVLVAWATDRITRHPIELEELIDVLNDHAIDVHTVAGGEIDLQTTDGRTMARIMGTLARAESERKSDRVKSKYRELCAAGLPSGGPAPYGYRRVDKNYVIDPETSAHVRFMADEILAGTRLQTLTAMLNENGIPSHKGKPWHPGRVKRAVTNPAVTALREYRPRDRNGKQLPGEIAGEGVWEPILDRATWDAVCVVLMDPTRMRDNPLSKYPLTGLIYSRTNDKPMRGQRDDSAKNGGQKHRIYQNTTAYVNAEKAEAIVFNAALDLLESGTFSNAASSNELEDIEALETELQKLRELKNTGRLDLDEYLDLRDPLHSRLQAAQARQRLSRPARAILDDPAQLRVKWAAQDEERATVGDYTDEQLVERRGVVLAMFDRIWVHRATKARWTPMEERLELIPRP